jgi:hypothetical protein
MERENKRRSNDQYSIISSYIKSLQGAIQTFPKYSEDLESAVEDANREVRSRLDELDLPKVDLTYKIISDAANPPSGKATIRDTCPTKTLISTIVSPEGPFNVEFYMSRPRVDGVAETRLLGSTRHPDADGSRSFWFTTERFANRPDEPTIIHGEVRDKSGDLAAVVGIAVVN